MLFNSIDFIIFLPIVFFLYWFVFNKSLKQQNILVLVSSYVFYGWWQWKFLSLILFSTLIDYAVGVSLGKSEGKRERKMLLAVSILCNLGLLGFFKYSNFFIQNFIDAFSFFGLKANIHTLQIVLPVGISFYTFQTMSYTIDVYRRKMLPTKDFVAFAAFVSFFPQLVAGPIERATHLLPQFFKPKKFEYHYAVDGMRQIIWGLFKKVVIADTCAKYVDVIFAHYTSLHGGVLILGAVLFAFQIYGDFSGYSDVAIGVAKLFGYDLMQNFAYPYFSRDIAEFWRRWHISLSTWFRDYVYIPLGGSRVSKAKQIRNTMIVFLVSGFWHGANWTFIVWGALNAFYFLPLLLMQKNRQNMDIVASGRWLPSLQEGLQIIITFTLTVIAWIFFRAKSVTEATQYIINIFTSYTHNPVNVNIPVVVYLLILLLVLTEWLQRDKKHGFYFSPSSPKLLRWASYFFITFITAFFLGKENTFIYFQF